MELKVFAKKRKNIEKSNLFLKKVNQQLFRLLLNSNIYEQDYRELIIFKNILPELPAKCFHNFLNGIEIELQLPYEEITNDFSELSKYIKKIQEDTRKQQEKTKKQQEQVAELLKKYSKNL